MSTVQVNTLFESSIWSNRDNMDDWSDRRLANRCINDCYALPFYGRVYNQQVKNRVVEEKQYPEELSCEDARGDYGNDVCTPYELLTEFYDESEFHLPSPLGVAYLSTRRGQYCHKEGEPDNWVSGGITSIGGTGECGAGDCYDCTPGAGSESKDEDKERDYPIYLTNDEWLRGISERTRSVADCGYKSSINGDYSDPETEMITAIIQKLSQKGNVKKNITVEQIIWKAGAYIQGPLEPYETTLDVVVNPEEDPSNCAATGGICMNADYCDDEAENGEIACPSGAVCCTMQVD